MERSCYSEEWKRSAPDFAVYLPRGADTPDAENQHLNVVATPGGVFLAFWTQAAHENAPNQRVVVSRSEDRARTWSPPLEIDGPRPDDPPGTGLASWGFPVVAPGIGDAGARVYCFYNKNVGVSDAREGDTGVLRCRYSDDDGLTWSRERLDYPIAPNALSHPDPSVPPVWIVYQVPLVTPEGAVLAGFTRWASDALEPGRNLLERTSEVCFLRFEDILEQPDPTRLTVSTWPRSPHGLRVAPAPRSPMSVAQEPTVQSLEDGRLLCVMRTLTGVIHFALSADDGRTWGEPAPLRREPGGEALLNPIAPCPLYRLGDGRLLLIFYNNDGTANGASGPTDYKRNRTPAWCAVGAEIPGHPTHPVRFGPPRVLLANDGVPAGPLGRTEIATYCSYFEREGVRYLWYPDRKHFLLGKRLGDDLLAGS